MSQIDELKAAVKAVAKARAEGKPIDLSALPPHLRQKIEAQLQKLPPETRQQLQNQGRAAVDKIAHKASTHLGGSPVRTPELPKYHGHYNNTIKAGDATHVPWFWLIGVAVGTIVLAQYID